MTNAKNEALARQAFNMRKAIKIASLVVAIHTEKLKNQPFFIALPKLIALELELNLVKRSIYDDHH